jgi:hypothetical protein
MPDPKRKPTASVLELFSKSYGLVKANLNIFILLYSVSALFALWNFLNWFTNDKLTWSQQNTDISNTFSSLSGVHFTTPAGVAVGLAIFMAVAAVILGLMQVILTLLVSQGKKPDFADIWHIFVRKGFKLLLLEVVMGLILIVGFLALIIPGVILLWRLFLAPYLLLDKDIGIQEALRRSWNLTRGYAWPIYSVILFAILLSITGAIPYLGPIISFLLLVAFAVAPALRYQELKEARHRASP